MCMQVTQCTLRSSSSSMASNEVAVLVVTVTVAVLTDQQGCRKLSKGSQH
jgi:hypothetical protein